MNSAKDLEARRRLLKASAAAPLIATLTPSSALALSSAAACSRGGKDDLSGEKYATFTDDPHADSAVRRRVDCWTKNKGPGPKEVYLIDGNYYDGHGGYASVSPDKLRDNYTHSDKYVLVMFDVSGSGAVEKGSWPMVKSGKEGMKGTPLSGSCWASINGTGTVDLA